MREPIAFVFSIAIPIGFYKVAAMMLAFAIANILSPRGWQEYQIVEVTMGVHLSLYIAWAGLMIIWFLSLLKRNVVA